MRTSIVKLATILSFLFALPLFGQAPPCRPGNLGAVLGTSCSVGPVIFNFDTTFSGVFDTSTTFQLIDPTSIGFVPVANGDQSGFTLILNYTDATSPAGFSAHSVVFSYSPQAAPGTELRSQSVAMDAAISGTVPGSRFVSVDDERSYPNSPFVLDAFATLNPDGPPEFNRLSDHHFLEVPAFAGTVTPGLATTSMGSEAQNGSSASLTSVSFIYTSGPVLPIPAAAQLTFKIIDLPNVPGTFVGNITNSGRTVGSVTDAAGSFHGYVAEADGVTFKTFDFPGARGTFPAALNDHGDIVGTYRDASARDHGFLLSNGVFSTIDVPNSRRTETIGLNDKGQIVGEYQSQDRGFHGFLFDKGIFTTIDHGPGTGLFASTGAFGINNASEIVGFFFDPDTFRAFSQKGQSFAAADVPGQGDTINENVNNSGDTVGIFNDINLVNHGYLLSKGAFLTVDVPGSVVSFPLGINAAGTIVGQFTGADGLTHSYLATPGANGVNGQRATAVQNAAPIDDCNSEEWRTRHAQRHNLTACRVGK
jgi:hypothetical protein